MGWSMTAAGRTLGGEPRVGRERPGLAVNPTGLRLSLLLAQRCDPGMQGGGIAGGRKYAR